MLVDVGAMDAGSQMHLQMYVECRDPILTRYGPTLDHGDRLVHAMKRIDDRLTVMEQWSYRSQMTSSMTDYFNENLPYHVAEYRSVVGH